jgi:hypothetical protein
MFKNPLRVQFEAQWRKAGGPRIECDYRIGPALVVDYAIPHKRIAIVLDKRRPGTADLGLVERHATKVRASGWCVHVIRHGQQVAKATRLARLVTV